MATRPINGGWRVPQCTGTAHRAPHRLTAVAACSGSMWPGESRGPQPRPGPRPGPRGGPPGRAATPCRGGGSCRRRTRPCRTGPAAGGRGPGWGGGAWCGADGRHGPGAPPPHHPRSGSTRRPAPMAPSPCAASHAAFSGALSTGVPAACAARRARRGRGAGGRGARRPGSAPLARVGRRRRGDGAGRRAAQQRVGEDADAVELHDHRRVPQPRHPDHRGPRFDGRAAGRDGPTALPALAARVALMRQAGSGDGLPVRDPPGEEQGDERQEGEHGERSPESRDACRLVLLHDRVGRLTLTPASASASAQLVVRDEGHPAGQVHLRL